MGERWAASAHAKKVLLTRGGAQLTASAVQLVRFEPRAYDARAPSHAWQLSHRRLQQLELDRLLSKHRKPQPQRCQHQQQPPWHRGQSVHMLDLLPPLQPSQLASTRLKHRQQEQLRPQPQRSQGLAMPRHAQRLQHLSAHSMHHRQT